MRGGRRRYFREEGVVVRVNVVDGVRIMRTENGLSGRETWKLLVILRRFVLELRWGRNFD